MAGFSGRGWSRWSIEVAGTAKEAPMRILVCLSLTAVASLAVCPASQAQVGASIWDRHDAKTGNLFEDYRARQLGDVLTLVINEITESDAQEKRNAEKKTLTSANFKFNGSSSIGNSPTKQFSTEFDGQGQSQRKFDGTSNMTIDRKFGDKISVVVIGVMPNGNLIIEGYRKRVVAREVRILRVSGIVRPADIGAFNQVQSQYVANFEVNYAGRGPDTNY